MQTAHDPIASALRVMAQITMGLVYGLVFTMSRFALMAGQTVFDLILRCQINLAMPPQTKRKQIRPKALHERLLLMALAAGCGQVADVQRR